MREASGNGARKEEYSKKKIKLWQSKAKAEALLVKSLRQQLAALSASQSASQSKPKHPPSFSRDGPMLDGEGPMLDGPRAKKQIAVLNDKVW